jgi:hypothetical protein
VIEYPSIKLLPFKAEYVCSVFPLRRTRRFSLHCSSLIMSHAGHRFTTPQPWDQQPGFWVITTLSMLFSLQVFAGRWTIRRQFSSADITLCIACVRELISRDSHERALLKLDSASRCNQLGRSLHRSLSWRRHSC